MARKRVLMTALLLSASQLPASAQTAPTMTVQSLLNDGYTVVGVHAGRIGGAGVFLQNGHALVMCFIAETPESPTVATQYCKPVK